MEALSPFTALHDFVFKCRGQKAAAQKLGCSPQFVGQMFHGQRPVPKSLYRKLGLRRTVIAAK